MSRSERPGNGGRASARPDTTRSRCAVTSGGGYAATNSLNTDRPRDRPERTQPNAPAGLALIGLVRRAVVAEHEAGLL